ncbi:glutamine--fructose-6-phosphate transaminase (isomerizing) [Asticcacaulis taihuensis]|uniref:Glutamine--fructose-6-phosphate aminotransferase [isomerizing] n=1 Tax=Asticcacaulis taihuensis TaxID=260084 RepID=A0A1G4RH67_9CAUL|nr:glutamine--fructose-6-phosphate transaminase (isomerizing) [Asticcacaulis taihuensis]SCW56204.1 glucosamine--fructose-6-phosphate aminotransferase (isomerizing) [Asticcacaulis taihuensis]
MCGIIGIIGNEPVAPRLLESLRRLEYRGYDSAGIAVQTAKGTERRRAEGKIRNLETAIEDEPLAGQVGIGHTRWATHGAPSVRNAHPHHFGQVTVVHNGIIENFAELKAGLMAQGEVYDSDTDTEVIAHLLNAELATGAPLRDAFKATLDRLHGAYALAILIDGEDRTILGARRGSPLVVGWGGDEMYLGSDALAVGPFTNRVSYLEEGDWVVLGQNSAEIHDAAGNLVNRPAVTVSASAALVEKGSYRHFMEKEVHEQPESTQRTLTAYLDPVTGGVRADIKAGVDFSTVSRLQIIACGTAYYAGSIARYAFEKLAGLPVDVEVASEFRYRSPAMMPGVLAVAVSQSGETADTLAALRWCQSQGLKTAAVVNVHTSTMAREADLLWPTHAGPEIGVASTKAFTAQLSALLSLAVTAAAQRGRINAAEEGRLAQVLLGAPGLIAEALGMDGDIVRITNDLSKARDVIYLGRGETYPLALEGALKLKEISYIHAEGYAAGELKHGPIALIDENTPVVVIAPDDELFEKTASNVQEVAARGGRVIMITNAPQKVPTLSGDAAKSLKVIQAPDCDPFIAALVYSVPIQLLAYHTAVHKGTDVDQPRNLAKSVTVE